MMGLTSRSVSPSRPSPPHFYYPIAAVIVGCHRKTKVQIRTLPQDEETGRDDYSGFQSQGRNLITFPNGWLPSATQTRAIGSAGASSSTATWFTGKYGTATPPRCPSERNHDADVLAVILPYAPSATQFPHQSRSSGSQGRISGNGSRIRDSP